MAVLLLPACQEETVLTDLEAQRQGGGGNQNGNGNDNGNGDFNANGSELTEKWIDLLLELDRHSYGMRPTSSSRAFAYINLAAYETAVPGMNNYHTNSDRLAGFDLDFGFVPDDIDYPLAVNEAYSIVLDHFIINVDGNRKNEIRRLRNRIEDELSRGMDRDVERESKDWGKYIAKQVISYSQTDEAALQQVPYPQPSSYEPPTGQGYWTYSAPEERALFPYWGSVRTFVISPEETTTIAPIPYSEAEGSAYYAEMYEAYEVNNAAKNGDDEQLWIAEFWSDDVEGLMFGPPARQLSIANQLVDQENLSFDETLALFLKLGFVLNDAAVATWKYKYEHMVMRPNVYIHEFIDPDFQTNLFRLVYWPNPSFPGYPSGHSAFASAAGGVFRNFFGDSIDFTDRSHKGRSEFQGNPRSFSSFSQMAEENAYSRIPLGVHIRMDCDEGLRLGYEISDAVNNLDLNEEIL